ncbi:MAG: PolC-type DNA polymerase III [Bacilli bacterium]
MHDKLELLLKQIDFNKEYYSYFMNGNLEKIIVSKVTEEAKFIITIDKILPVKIYDLFCELSSRKYNEYRIVPVFTVRNKDTDELNNYLYYYSQILLNEQNANFEDTMKELNLSNCNGTIKISETSAIDINNYIEEMTIELNNSGFEDINFVKNNQKTVIKKEETIKKEISKVVIKGREIIGKTTKLEDIIKEENLVILEGEIFDFEVRETPKTNIITLKITDGTDSIYGKIFEANKDDYKELMKNIKVGKNYKFRGKIKDDLYSKELVLSIYDIMLVQKEKEEIKDNSLEKRIELHAHTKMSQMDGICDDVELVKQAIKFGHKGIAITDHNGCQSFPNVYNEVKNYNKNNPDNPFKAIYGVELTCVNDEVLIVTRPNDSKLSENTYIVFDVETTGFNAGLSDSMIEIGAVKIKDGEILERFDELIDPGKKIDIEITEVTNITDTMLIGKPNEKEVVIKFKEFIKEYPLVAHNAKFDMSMLEMAYYKYDLGEITNPVIDTLELSRTLDREHSKHSLSALVKRYAIPFDEEHHHRADYDAEATAYILSKMIINLNLQEIFTLNDLKKLVTDDEQYIFASEFHLNLLALNKTGLKNMFKIISYANTDFMSKGARIPKSMINKYREGLLVGSGCSKSEVFIKTCTTNEENLKEIINFYDYVEVQPPEVYEHLILGHDIDNKSDLELAIKKIIKCTKETNKIIVATGDVHHIKRDDKIYREIIVNQKVPGGGRHPLIRTLNKFNKIPSMHFRTTEEMLNDFSFLGNELAHEIVVKNPNKILEKVEQIEVIIETNGIPFSPKIENSEQTTKDLVFTKAFEMYGNPLPQIISQRIEQELTGIIKGGFDVIYLIAQKLVKKSNDDGYLVGSRGSVGSSFVATMMGITEVNPLPAHYRCPNCKKSIFEIDGISLGTKYSSGYDLPDMNCPNCNTNLLKDGQDMPFATFLGFDADKVPDIDLNFSGEYQWKAHEYTKELFGIDNVYRAGTIGTVADKTAYGFALGYYEDRGIKKRGAEIERLAKGCIGVKRTTGQHPGGIVVIPGYMDVFDFTPFQYPADDKNSLWRTTHFDYHAIDQDVLKLDILGHDDPTVLRMLQDLSHMDVTKIPLDDKDTMSIFSSPEILGVTSEQIMCETGTLGIPEFGTKFVTGMLNDTKPKTFGELVKISGLSHGTDVWLGNARDLIKQNVVLFKDVIGCRDDIMVYLMYQGLEPKKAFKIMEFVRKGKPSKDPEKWAEFKTEMKEAKIEDWFIDSCQKIKYMFPKAHAAAYVMSAFRIAWFKVHRPLWYYAAYLSIRCFDFDIQSMVFGYNSIKHKIIEITEKGKEATNKDASILEVLQIALEATARGIEIGNIDILKSDSDHFIIKGDHTLIPPFRTIDGLGGTVANKIIEERNIRPFISIEDLQKRAKISSTVIEKMRVMGVLDGMDESSQLSLF